MSFSPQGQREMLAELHRLAAEREHAERQMRTDFDEATVRNQQLLSDSRQAAIMRFQMDRDTTQREYDKTVERSQAIYESARQTEEVDFQQSTAEIHSKFKTSLRKAKKQLSEQTWETNTVFEATQGSPKIQLKQDEKDINSTHAVAKQSFDLANQHLAASRLSNLRVDAPQEEPLAKDEPTAIPVEQAFANLTDLARNAIANLEALKRLRTPQLLSGGHPWALFAVWAVLLCGGAVALFGHESSTWLIVGGVVAVASSIAAGFWLYRTAAAHASKPYTSIVSGLAAANKARQVALAAAKHRADAESQRILERRDQDLRASQERFENRIQEITTKRDERLAAVTETHTELQAELLQSRDTALQEAHTNFPQRLDEIQKRYQRDLREAQAYFDSTTTTARATFEQAFTTLAERWKTGIAPVAAIVQENSKQNWQFFPAWNDPRWHNWQPPTAPPPTLRFGQFNVDLRHIPGGISSEERLNGLIPRQFELPALLPFPRNASLLIKAEGEGRRRAVEAVQSLMLRMITSIPPGKVRFTIIDPVGLGENFAGFMHLADHDEMLVNNRIWTEPQHIEQRLADLTEQMENVIQKYLRNEFQSIDEYNAFAGEVAEPFRILVVANFPVNFTETAARRLMSIATSGARCGVYTLIVNDTKQPLPPKFDIKDLERSAVTLVWNGQSFVWQDADYQQYPLWIETPPGEEQFTRLVQAVGKGAKEGNRVEVPFEYVAPQPDAWWTGDTSRGISVPLGRAGATKLQYLKLGSGTSQHVLVAGKTGSGKSTLLHAMVTNLALTYSPSQIEMYLIDFKKGVEFKTYATHQLPHARVIAIESEREFGVSVIEKLDAELKRRGDLFRDAGVQDVAAYRAVAGDDSLPRIMLVVDEFQELFTDDDKLAQDAALLLDRLVRQGRAFGMHVLLGSQTLGGAYSLARSTIGQMAVRIALQCSEADAHLILSEENSAARLLTRPGEAIYNDANGLVQGNHPFQIVWLSDERREDYLLKLQDLAQERVAAGTMAEPGPQIVFEGNAASDLRRNRALSDLLRSADWPVRSTPAHAWLGEAIAIKDPTAAVLRPQSGSNLLVVGQRAEITLGMLASTMIGLAAQHRATTGDAAAPSGFAAGSPAEFYVLEHDRPADLPIDAIGADFRSGLSSLARFIPHPFHVSGRRDLPKLFTELTTEIARRQAIDDQTSPAIYFFISDLGRFRDLRRDESDMGFSFGSDKPASPSAQLGTILRDGPTVGIYSLIWCDSLNSVNRCFDRQSMREFALRVLLQMSANDSSYLIDTPLASKLGPHVALFQNEEEGRLEKFRPYAWPSQEWLAAVQERFNLRVPAGNR
jgi:S-DNA-T family DNA segregation ATPase FtsK/SpoIIIE